MSITWDPVMASQQVEELMEAQELPESDRDEIRRFSEFLKRRKDLREGKQLLPPPEGMKEWLGG